ncbi:MAG: RHS repeat-associated core domain-containing protein, partial [Phycisphaerales bacterium JB054]
DSGDSTHANSITGGYQTLGRGVLSSTGVNNRRGYAGYEYDPTFEGADRHLYHVRHRVYDADSGRWTRRDPFEYHDGLSMYAYVGGWPVVARDPSGLAAIIDQPTTQPSGPKPGQPGLPIPECPPAPGIPFPESPPSPHRPDKPGTPDPPGMTPPPGYSEVDCSTVYFTGGPRNIRAHCHNVCKKAGWDTSEYAKCYVKYGKPNTGLILCSCILLKPGDCTSDRHKKLQDDVNAKCKKDGILTANGYRCPPYMNNPSYCNTIAGRINRGKQCYDARKKIIEECYRGVGDVGHRHALNQVARSVQNCEAMYRNLGCARRQQKPTRPKPPGGGAGRSGGGGAVVQ